MKKILKNLVASMAISLLFTSIMGVVMLDAMSGVISKENIIKVIGQFNINDVLQTNLEQYQSYLDGYTDSTNIYDLSKLNSTNINQDELEEVLNSEQYANLLGDYIVEEDVINTMGEIQEDDYEKVLESINQEDVKKLFSELGIDYTEKDANYITNTIPAIAPTVVQEMQNSMSFNVNSLKFDLLDKVFSKGTFVAMWFFLVVCLGLVVWLYFDKYTFTLVISMCTGLIAIMSKAVVVIVEKGIKAIPEEYVETVNIFVNPLVKCMNRDFVICLVAMILCIIIYLCLNFVITKDSIGESIKFLHLVRDMDEEDEEIDDFSDIDFSDIEVRDIDKEIDDFF